MGKIRVRSSGDWHPGRREKSFGENYENMTWDHDKGTVEEWEKFHNEKMTESKVCGRSDSKYLPDSPTVQMTHSELCDCGCLPLRGLASEAFVPGGGDNG